MDPRDSAQDVVLCDVCKDNVVQSYCALCDVNLCKPCIGDHISDDYDKHKIVPYRQRKSTLIFPICKTHLKETCKLHCKTCNIIICAKCCISEHKGHNFIDLEDRYNSKKTNIENDTEEIENVISPTYGEIRNELEYQIASLDEEYEKLTRIMTKQGEEWHKEIDRAVEQIKNEIIEIKVGHRDILIKHLKEIEQIETLMTKHLFTLKNLQKESNVVSSIMGYRSRNNEFGKLPPKIYVSLPTFCTKPIDREKIHQLFGSIKPLTSTAVENGYTLKKLKRPFRKLLDKPEVINMFNTGYKNLRCVSVHSNQEIWTSAEVPEIKCFNFKGKSIDVITPKSGQWPNNIAVTKDGSLLYSDWTCQTVNKVTDEQVDEIIKLRGWIPGYLCETSSGDLLVEMCDENSTQVKIVRYFGSTQKQTIQYEENDKPLFSVNYKAKYLTENRNLDICVADYAAGAVVVVNQAGKLQFRYTGHPPILMRNSFFPLGIATNSQSHILISDFNSHYIHVLESNGQFLCYIENMSDSFGLCVDKHDNLFVTEYSNGNVTVIKYLN